MFNKKDNSIFSEEEQISILNELNALFPKNIKWEHDGIYKKVIVIKSKNYILDDGKNIKLKGSSLKDTKKEQALKEFLKDCINILLDDGSLDRIHNVYTMYIREALNIKDINRWTTKKTITKSIFDSPRLNESKVRDAIKNHPVQEGDKIWLYTALEKETQLMKDGEPQFYKDGRPKMVENNILKLADKWSQDEDKLHYVERVYNTLCILENVINIESFIPYHKKKNQHLLESL
jgi:DNA polymerase elongation subunit (family B)